MLHGFTQTNAGKVRSNNEDAFWLGGSNNWCLALVADGMGGHQAGEVASSQAVDIISRTIQDHAFNSDINIIDGKKVLCDAVQVANKSIYYLGQSQPGLTGMGTTVTAALFCKQKVNIAQVGDSRVYLYRQGALIQLTEDHSLVQELVNSGSISAEQARSHPKRHLLTRVVGTSADIKVDFFSAEVEQGDIFLLCTDGLTCELTDDEIKQILMSSPPNQAAGVLVQAALDSGGHDNVTVALVYASDKR